jgi:hypothetical protein
VSCFIVLAHVQARRAASDNKIVRSADRNKIQYGAAQPSLLALWGLAPLMFSAH